MMHVGEYQEYIGGYSVQLGFQYKLKGFDQLALYMHHDIPPSPDVIMISPDVLMISPDVLMVPRMY